jgi:PAS domain S-box-containing protein
MKIRTQFIILTAVFAAILAGLGLATLVGSIAIQSAVNSGVAVSAIDTQITELNYLTNDYLLYHETLQLSRWQTKYDEIKTGLSSLNGLSAEESASVTNLNTEMANTQSVFNEATAAEQLLPADQSPDPSFVQLYWSRLEIQNQSMHFDVTRLSQLITDRERALRQTLTYLVIGLTAMFGLSLIGNYFLNYRRIISSLSHLRAGAAVIGSGNLDYRVTDGRRDEVGELAGAFNRMTADLKQVTASKAQLETEVEERKKAEAQLAHLASFPALNPSPVVELNAEGVVTYTNRAAREQFPDLESLGDAHPFFKDWEKALYDLRHGAPQLNREFMIRGRWEWQTISYVVDTDSLRFYSRNITERIEAEEALQETSTYLNNLFDYANAPIITWDPQFRITRFNHAFERLTGLKASGVLGQPLDILFPGSTSKDAMELIHRTAKGQKWEVVEIPIQHRDGSIKTVLWNSAPIYAADNQTVVSTIAQGQDITERVEAEDALADSEERLRLHAENSPLAVVEWDQNFVVTRWAGAAESMFGWKASETIGKPIADLKMIYEPDIPIVNDTMTHLSDGFTRAYTSSNRNLTKDGRVIWCTWYNSVLYDDNGKMKSVMSQVQDVTEHRRIDRAKDEFIGLVSHELRNPLTVVLGSVQTALAPGLSDEEVKLMLQNAAEGSKSMERIIANLLELSRAQADRLKLAREKIDVAAIARQAVGQVKLLYPFHRYAVKEVNKIPAVSADPVRIERILFNLVENAAKYSPVDTPIGIELTRADATLIVSVADQGMGIPADRMGEMFEPFQRLVDQSTHAKGLGLGLVVCKRLVEAHGGKIWAESKEGCGTTFFFTLTLG